MQLCFVIQPFDSGPFDARYDDTLVPAIRAAGFEPYRVDRDPKVMIPIASIERMIRSADCCLADVTDDNPNVWLELGFALAAAKPVVLIAKHAPRKRFPFDVQHRQIIRYRTDSERDFRLLRAQISQRLPEVAKAWPGAITTANVVAPSESQAPFEADVRRIEDLRTAIESVDVQKDAVFSRLKLIFDIRANRAYENYDEPNLAKEIYTLARKEAAQFASQHGLSYEWRQWLRLSRPSSRRRAAVRLPRS